MFYHDADKEIKRVSSRWEDLTGQVPESWKFSHISSLSYLSPEENQGKERFVSHILEERKVLEP